MSPSHLERHLGLRVATPAQWVPQEASPEPRGTCHRAGGRGHCLAHRGLFPAPLSHGDRPHVGSEAAGTPSLGSQVQTMLSSCPACREGSEESVPL